MARKSKARRNKAKLAAASIALRVAKSQELGLESAKLQQGSPRVTTQVRLSRVTGLARPPKPQGDGGEGKVKKGAANRVSVVKVVTVDGKGHAVLDDKGKAILRPDVRVHNRRERSWTPETSLTDAEIARLKAEYLAKQ